MAKVHYFQHDFLARQDPKLLAIQEQFGLEGLGFFWCLVEYLYEQGGKLPTASVDAFAYQMHFDKGKAQQIVNDFDLFEFDEDVFWSPSIMRRIDKMSEIAGKRRQAAQNRWNKVIEPVKKETAAKGPEIDFAKIIDTFHQHCPSLATVQKISESRKAKIKARFKEMNSDINVLIQVFDRVESSAFCKGENNRGWKADFDWIMANDSNWQKIMSGRYDNRSKATGKNQPKNANDEWN